MQETPHECKESGRTPTVQVQIAPRTAQSYPIYIASGLMPHMGEEIARAFPSTIAHATRHAVILTDRTVDQFYGHALELDLVHHGFATFRHIIQPGETSKNADNLMALLSHMAAEGLTRSDILIALGGGVVGDLGGLAASLYMRGISFVQIPTSLLAMVDSSVGGKTAIDLPEGKNLIGTFCQPSLVLCDPDCLDTLPSEMLADGFAEIIKYAMIRDQKLGALLSDRPLQHMSEIIRLCVEDKRALVEADETDRGVRQLLNLGHTVGHAVEVCSRFNITHGHAVAIGMMIMTRAAISAGICDPSALETLEAWLNYFNLPVSCPFTADQLFDAALADKKRSGGFITLAVPYHVADTRLITVPTDALEIYIRKGLGDLA